MNERPYGIDPGEVVTHQVEGFGEVDLVFIPRSRYLVLEAELAALEEQHRPVYQDMLRHLEHRKDPAAPAGERPVAELVLASGAIRADAVRAERQLCAWGIGGWRPAMPPLRVVAGPAGREWQVLSPESLDLLEAQNLLTTMAGLVRSHWTLTPGEKKP